MVATDVKTEFERLKKEWYDRTSFHSNPDIIFGHPAYQKMIDLGPEIIPLVFEEVKQHRGWWILALHLVVGVNPIPEKMRGRYPEMVECWLKWGREHGYTE